MDIRELNYFYQVAKNKSFTKASQILHVSQPALSKIIKKLENEIGTKLFERSYKNIELTEMGEFFFKKIEILIIQYEEFKTSLSSKIQEQKKSLIVGIPPMGSSIFACIFSLFYSKYKNIPIDIIENGSFVLEQELEEGKIDIGIVALPLNPQKFNIVPIKEIENVLVLNKNHTLNEKNSVTFKDLKNEYFWLLDKRFMLNHQIFNTCKKNGFTPLNYFESPNINLLVEFVAQNQGITILPKFVFNTYINSQINLVNFLPSFKTNNVFIF